MPYVAFALRQRAGALRQLIQAEAAALYQSTDPRATMRVRQLKVEAGLATSVFALRQSDDG
jgi:hypothetical protein